jgi:F-type H+-transporting ATPase subunit b
MIDWFTVAAQILNFLVLVALLKHFLYDRIISAMDERERKIQDRLETAEQKKEEAGREAEKYHQQKEKLEAQQKELFEIAKQEAEEKRKELVGQIRQEIEEKRRGWEKNLQKEKSEFLHELGRMATQEVYAAVRRTLKDLADAELEEKSVDAFLNVLEKAEEDVRKELTRFASKRGRPLLVRSSFDISGTLQQKVTRKIHELFSEDIDIDYQTDPELLLGIEIKGQSRKIAWHAEAYLERLQEESRKMFEDIVQEEGGGQRSKKAGEGSNSGKAP